MNPSEQNDDVPVRSPEGGRGPASSSRSDESASAEWEQRARRESERGAREREDRDGPPVVPARSGMVFFRLPDRGEVAIPAPWRAEPQWLREHGRTSVLVI